MLVLSVVLAIIFSPKECGWVIVTMMKSNEAAVVFLREFQQNGRLPARRSARCFTNRRMVSG